MQKLIKKMFRLKQVNKLCNNDNNYTYPEIITKIFEIFTLVTCRETFNVSFALRTFYLKNPSVATVAFFHWLGHLSELLCLHAFDMVAS